MRLRKQCCYYCICGYIEKERPPKVYCTAIADFVSPNGLCDKFKNKKDITNLKHNQYVLRQASKQKNSKTTA